VASILLVEMPGAAVVVEVSARQVPESAAMSVKRHRNWEPPGRSAARRRHRRPGFPVHLKAAWPEPHGRVTIDATGTIPADAELTGGDEGQPIRGATTVVPLSLPGHFGPNQMGQPKLRKRPRPERCQG
jgi:hypothetical protein